MAACVNARTAKFQMNTKDCAENTISRFIFILFVNRSHELGKCNKCMCADALCSCVSACIINSINIDYKCSKSRDRSCSTDSECHAWTTICTYILYLLYAYRTLIRRCQICHMRHENLSNARRFLFKL